MDHVKRYIAQHSFQIEHKKRTKPTRKKRAAKTPRPKPLKKPKATPKPRATDEAAKQARREYNRLRRQRPEVKERQSVKFKERLEEAKALGLCRNCRKLAIEGQTRCEECAERHRVSRREHDRKRRAAAKQSDEQPDQGPVAPASPKRTAPQPDMQAEQGRLKPDAETRTPSSRQEYERLRRQRPERQEAQRQAKKKRQQRARELGLCRDCNAEATSGQTRCESCAEKRRQARRRSDASKGARKKAEQELNS